MTATLTFVVIIVVIALVFDYINGFHDAANSIATVVSTRVLSPGAAVVWAAFFNFIAFVVLGEAVAKTIGKDMVDIQAIPPTWQLWVLLCGLIGAIVWNLITWYYGIPSSSSHALVGGYAGAAVAASGFSAILPGGWTKTLIFIVLSPLIGALLGFAIMVAVMWIFRRWSPHKVDRFFRKGQLVSAALFSLGHGGNDAQKTMGIIAGVLVASNLDAGQRPRTSRCGSCSSATRPSASALCRAAGASSTRWGRASRSSSPSAASAPRRAAALSIIGVTFGGIPVSTTHTITGAIVGVGATRRLSAVKWGVAGRIVWAWVLTIPAAAAIAALSFLLYRVVSALIS